MSKPKRETKPLTSTLEAEHVEPAEPVAGPAVVDTDPDDPVSAKVEVPADYVLVNLKQVVRINGVAYGPGEQVLVPASGYEVWKHALA